MHLQFRRKQTWNKFLWRLFLYEVWQLRGTWNQGFRKWLTNTSPMVNLRNFGKASLSCSSSCILGNNHKLQIFSQTVKDCAPICKCCSGSEFWKTLFLLFISYDVLILLFYSRGRDKIRIITFLNEGWIYCFDKPLHRGVVDPAITGHRHYWFLLGGLNASKSTIYNT